ncbi:hypothetical protein [Pseudomonas sp. LS-2]|uniref:hypothetical protein n=1 Tax=Pseudomonas sp. LS-2 TaxID=2315859 RepID=UPI000E75D947|nr:hypothetical protein [Pseudomonas sp. LS-2]RJX80319.1 hypothetical protein D3M70_12280 [Pseudomonas sp. LS-2]
MAFAEINLRIEYAEAFDFEDLRTIFHNVLAEAKECGALNLPASEAEDGVAVECKAIGQIWPYWEG